MMLIAQIEEKSNFVGRFYSEEALSIWTNICKHLYAYRSASFKTYYEGYFFQTHNAFCARLYT